MRQLRGQLLSQLMKQLTSEAAGVSAVLVLMSKLRGSAFQVNSLGSSCGVNCSGHLALLSEYNRFNVP